MGLGPSSTGMCGPRSGIGRPGPRGVATPPECSPRPSWTVNDIRTPSGTRVLPDLVPMAAPEPPSRMGPSGRACALRDRRPPARTERAVDGRPDDLRGGPADDRLGLPRGPVGADPAGAAGRAPIVERGRRARRDARLARLEAELAERLDTVLGIAGRLAASHDRAELFRMIVDETKRALRADATTIRILRDDRLEVAAWAGLDRRGRPDGCRSSGATRAGSARSCAPARSWPSPDVRVDRELGQRALRRRPRHRRPPRRAAHPPRPGHRRAVRGDARAARLDERRRGLHLDARDARRDRHLANAELFEQTVARAAQLEVLQAASARMSRADHGRGGRPDRRRGDRARSSTTTTPGSTCSSRPTGVVPIAFEGRVGAYEQVDMELLDCRLGEGFTGWVAQHGEPLLVNDANQRPARRDDRRDRRRRRVDARRADALRRRRRSASSPSRSSGSTSSSRTTCAC